MSVLSDTQRATLEAFCDTIVPSIEREPDPDGFWARKAGDLGVQHGVEELIGSIPDETIRAGLAQLHGVRGPVLHISAGSVSAACAIGEAYRDAGRIDDEVLRRVQHELDLEEAMLARD